MKRKHAARTDWEPRYQDDDGDTHPLGEVGTGRLICEGTPTHTYQKCENDPRAWVVKDEAGRVVANMASKGRAAEIVAQGRAPWYGQEIPDQRPIVVNGDKYRIAERSTLDNWIGAVLDLRVARPGAPAKASRRLVLRNGWGYDERAGVAFPIEPYDFDELGDEPRGAVLPTIGGQL